MNYVKKSVLTKTEVQECVCECVCITDVSV